jgi:hypothetical protein
MDDPLNEGFGLTMRLRRGTDELLIEDSTVVRLPGIQ